MNNKVLSLEEERFIKDTMRNVIFDLQEDDPDKWFAAVDELRQVLQIFGEDISDAEDQDD